MSVSFEQICKVAKAQARFYLLLMYFVHFISIIDSLLLPTRSIAQRFNLKANSLCGFWGFPYSAHVHRCKR